MKVAVVRNRETAAVLNRFGQASPESYGAKAIQSTREWCFYGLNWIPPMMIARRLFLVPLANNDHGKTTIVNALLSQGLGRPSPERKGQRTLFSPVGRRIDAYIFVRSYQETEKKAYHNVADALKANDPDWTKRELIVFPSHVSQSECDIDQDDRRCP